MKKLLLSVLAFMLSVAPAFATIEVQEDATREGNVSALNLGAGLDGSRSGGTYTVTVEASPVLTTVVLEGTTADAFETTLSAEDPTADNAVTLPNASGQVMVSTLATNTITAANSVYGASNALVFEGATADGFELSLTPADVGADLSVTLPTSTAAVATMYTALTTNSVDVANSVTGASNGLLFEGATADGFETTLAPTDVTADATITLPTITGTLHGSGAAVALTPGATPTLTVVPGKQVFTYQPADNTDATFNASGTGSAGDEMTFIFTTDAAGSGDEVMTFGTNMHSTGTLTMANLASDIYVVSFVSNGTKWVETARTAVQTT